MILKTWGNPSRPWKVTFFFRFGRVMCSVENYCVSRDDVALLLRRFRKARMWYHSLLYKRSSASWCVASPPAHVVAEDVPRFGLRWLAGHWSVVVVESRSGHHFATAITRCLRPTKVPFLRWFSKPFVDTFTPEERAFIEV